jgi:2-oxoglutarate dehydrogenase E2 component (dihydrolipoamide succinyltransferase)
MALTDVRLPALGEGITEATITRWLVKPGDNVTVETALVEIATDKVDSEVISPIEGTVAELLLPEQSIPKIGQVLLRINTEHEEDSSTIISSSTPNIQNTSPKPVEIISNSPIIEDIPSVSKPIRRFISPFVRQLSIDEDITPDELYQIQGTGLNERISKEDILNYILTRKEKKLSTILPDFKLNIANQALENNKIPPSQENAVPMDRVRKLIARNMVESKRIAPHVTVFSEADVTAIVNWRQKIKSGFMEKYGENLTYTPIFLEAVALALRAFPGINISVMDDFIIQKKEVNLGLAVALPDGNLIVPVVKNADMLNLPELAHQVNDLSFRARKGKLKPTEIQDGTFTITNIGAFGNISGTPIINLPQVAILAIGTIIKKPAAVEIDGGMGVGLRDLVTLSLSFDHRAVDGALGGTFLQHICQYINGFDINKTF